MLNAARRALYVLISLVLLPVSLSGYVLSIGMALTARKRSEMSNTALSPLSTRWWLHRLGLRADELAEKLYFTVPGVSRTVTWLAAGPTFLAIRVSGYRPLLARYPYRGDAGLSSVVLVRTEVIDAALDRYLERRTDTAKQVVILGAGFDTRAYTRARQGVEFFELDTAATQPFKRRALEEIGANISFIHFITVDFNAESWLDKLETEGFDRRLPSFFLWEGVTYYLESEAVGETLRTIATESAPGSVVVFDYFSKDFVSGENLGAMAPFYRLARAMVRRMGEPFLSGLDTSHPARQKAAEFLAPHGLKLEEHRNIGVETEQKEPMGGVVTAVVQAPPT